MESNLDFPMEPDHGFVVEENPVLFHSLVHKMKQWRPGYLLELVVHLVSRLRVPGTLYHFSSFSVF